MNDQRFLDQLDRAIEAATRHQAALLAYPGVVTVGAGPERRRGVLTGAAAIVVTVRRKRDVADLESGGRRPLPDELDGVAVDVVELGRPVEAPEIVAAQEKARRVIEAQREHWLSTPNVTGIGIGYKTAGGETDTRTIALKVFVAEKLADDEVRRRGLTPIPPEIDGVVTDVEEMKPLKPSLDPSGSRADRKDPLIGGISVGVGSKPFSRGTLGAVVFDRSDGRQLVLSNQHVLDAPAGTDVIQPAPVGLDDSIEVGFQLDVCNPLHFIRLDTPNTVLGSILAGGAVAAALAAALSDEIDPTRRGQEATVPPAGAQTLEEHLRVRLSYPELPIPGTHYSIHPEWTYTRRTTEGDLSHGADEVKVNPHALADKLLITDAPLYHPGDVVNLYALVLPESCAPQADGDDPTRPLTASELTALTHQVSRVSPNLSLAADVRAAGGEAAATQPAPNPDPDTNPSSSVRGRPRCRCERYHAVAILTPTKVDRAYPVVLREPVLALRGEIYERLLSIVRDRGDELLRRVFRLIRYGCLYTGSFRVADVPLGPWNHYLYVQTVNHAPAGLDPLQAAQIIGGLPVSQNSKPTIDVACGPFVFEDGSFDVELI